MEHEDKLVVWILEKREAEFVAVSTQMIRLKASLIEDTNPKFKASDDKGVSKIKPPPKSILFEWITAAQEKIERTRPNYHRPLEVTAHPIEPQTHEGYD